MVGDAGADDAVRVGVERRLGHHHVQRSRRGRRRHAGQRPLAAPTVNVVRVRNLPLEVAPTTLVLLLKKRPTSAKQLLGWSTMPKKETQIYKKNSQYVAGEKYYLFRP